MVEGAADPMPSRVKTSRGRVGSLLLGNDEVDDTVLAKYRVPLQQSADGAFLDDQGWHPRRL